MIPEKYITGRTTRRMLAIRQSLARRGDVYSPTVIKVLAFLVIGAAHVAFGILRFLFREEGRRRQEPTAPAPPRLQPAGERPRTDCAAPEAPEGQYVGPAYVSQVARNSECQVCGNALNSEIVSCKDCGTLHHQECWTYAGGCSTYACPSSRPR